MNSPGSLVAAAIQSVQQSSGELSRWFRLLEVLARFGRHAQLLHVLAVEGFLSIITRRRIRRGVFETFADLQEAIRRYIKEHDKRAKPFVGQSQPRPSSPSSDASLHPLNESMH